MDPDGELPPFVTPDKDLTACVDGAGYVEAKLAAMRAHPTQIQTDGGFFALSNNAGSEIWAQEFYRLAKGTPGPVDPETGLEDDLFAGLL
jgi:N-acetyl-1-D-myo-inositol-2-amino-2-deoxy-alpha-D-glucopyranoside deacetylase